MAHFYSKDGKAQYQTVTAKGDRLRPSTIRDAKKNDWLPSVNDILNVVNKPQLNKWFEDQPLNAVIANAEEMIEVLQSDPVKFKILAKEYAEVEKNKAPDFGTSLHDVYEGYLKWRQSGKKAIFTPEEQYRPWVRTFNDWFNSADITIEALEKVVVQTKGTQQFGGRIDFIGTYNGKKCYIDWKTQGWKSGKPVWYPSFGVQLAAYAHADGHLGDSALISVSIDRKDPKNLEMKIWDNNTELYNQFILCYHLYVSPMYKNWNPADGQS